MASLCFDANEIAPDAGGGPLPPGDYDFQAIEESLEEAGSGRGTVLKLTYEVIGGEYSGRKIWANMNIQHDNPVAQKIGQAELSALCHATGQMFVNDSEELLWRPFRATTKIETDKKTGKERAGIKKYHFGSDPQPPAEKAPPQRPVAPQQRPATAAPQRQAPATRPAAGAANRSLPWQGGRPAAQPQQAMAAAIDDDIPF